MRKLSKVLPLILVLLLARTTALGWDDTGHMVVAQIAYQRLTPVAKAKVDRLLIAPEGKRGLVFFCDKNYDPITIANWMDDLRDSSISDPLKEWHFINFNPLFDGIPERKIEIPDENVRERVKKSIETLRQLKDFDKTKVTSDDKASAEALGFLIHLVGDLHQPLHCTTRYSKEHPGGDFGGNLFTIDSPPAFNKLHAFWDGAGGRFGFGKVQRPLDSARAKLIRQFATAATTEFPADKNPEWQAMDPDGWVIESNSIARNFAFQEIKVNSKPSPEYINEAKRTAGKRIAFAGYRLAHLLNLIYGGN
jgi:S1/P1 Nuclease